VYLIDRADVLVSPDTGPLHVSVALDTPTVSLMGYTSPKRVGPYRRFHDVVLGSGSVPLGVLEDNVRLWIAQEKARP
jgi:heptosyltransferase I